MVFGQTEKFGIECNVHVPDVRTPNGDFWLWLDSNRIGDSIGHFDLALLWDQFAKPILMKSLNRCLGSNSTKEQVVQQVFEIMERDEPGLASDEDVTNLRGHLISAFDTEGFDDFFLSIAPHKDGNYHFVWCSKTNRKDVQEAVTPFDTFEAAHKRCYWHIHSLTNYKSPLFVWLGLTEDQKIQFRNSTSSERGAARRQLDIILLEYECLSLHRESLLSMHPIAAEH